MLLPSAGLADIVKSTGSNGRTVQWNITIDSDGHPQCTGAIALPFGSESEVPLVDIQCTLGAGTPATCSATGTQEYNQFVGKGDTTFTLRCTNKSVDFFIFDGGWQVASCDIPSDWLNKMHQVAGIYDAAKNSVSIYVDGRIQGSKQLSGSNGTNRSGYNLTIGACPDTGRNSQAKFSAVRIVGALRLV